VILARRLLAPTLLGIALAVAATVFISLRSQHALIVERENQQLSAAQATFYAMVSDRANTALALAISIADTPAVQQAYAAGDRRALEALMKPMYQELKQYFRLTQMQFHRPPAVAFLRMEAPRMFGDDVSAFRRSIVVSNADKSPQAGLEAGRTGIAMRGVVPVVHARQYLGTVGFGIALDGYFLEQFKARTGAESAVYLSRKTLDIMTAAVGMPSHDGPVPELGLLARTDEAVNAGAPLFARALRGESLLERIEVAGRPYVVGLAPLYDYSGEVIGVLQVDFPREDVLDRIATSRNTSLLLGISVMLLTMLAVWRLVARRLIHPLGELTAGVRGLEAGDRSARVRIDSGDELGDLGKAFNTMAAQLEQTLHGLEQNVAERERAEAEVRRLNEDLERRVAERTAQFEAANRKLEAANKELEAFSYSVSHDLRSPLRAIDGFAHILLEDHAERLGDEGAGHLRVIRRNVSRMANLIDDLLSFSRMARQDMSLLPIDMMELTQEVFEEVRANAPPERDIELQLGELPPARGDRAMVRQVLANLLSNAIKFTGPKPKAMIAVYGVAEGEQNTYRVKDNGVGFDMEYANMLFGVFQRLHGANEFEGTGIGLAIVKRVVSRHGGRVWAEGAPGEGACMYFTLPRA
jgi:signal transduction histidine kinase